MFLRLLLTALLLTACQHKFIDLVAILQQMIKIHNDVTLFQISPRVLPVKSRAWWLTSMRRAKQSSTTRAKGPSPQRRQTAASSTPSTSHYRAMWLVLSCCCGPPRKKQVILDPRHAEYVLGNIKLYMYLHFQWFLKTEISEIVEILPHGRQIPVYPV